ncbi:MAG TPA: GNAT family N-acetyltransferase, partial [Roseiflexaceae bacterium]|nr:GNAT family N-acetyltransferase [Roseiflexaceae bacterium]
MTTQRLDNPSYRRNLGDGLVLRWSTAADTAGLERLYSQVFRDSAESPPNTDISAYANDCMSGRHPLIGPGDFAVVEDTRHGTIVSATDLLEQTWEYEGVSFGIGRPEVVATDPDYRNRGLVRAIFELIHARSAARGHLAQAITGILFYYRQFGYEYALDLGGNRTVFFAAMPKLKDGQSEPYQLRQATLEDVPQLVELYEHERAVGPVSARVDAEYWRWAIDGQSDPAGEGWRTLTIVDAAGRTIGYVLPKRRRWGSRMGVA